MAHTLFPALAAFGLTLCLSLGHAAGAVQPPPGLGSEEFGLTTRQLVQAIEQVEQQIETCMREQGFQYVAVDHDTVRAGMRADKRMPGLSEEEFIDKYGFGVATLYAGRPPQLTTGYSPARVGLGERNVALFRSLSPADQVAYNRTLFGENPNATFAVGLETENFSQTGGCTRQAIEKIFKPEQLKSSYYNPQNALINSDPRMKAAVRAFATEMKKVGFDYSHPDDVEPDIRARLNALTANETIPLESMSASQREALKRLQDYERRVALTTFRLQEDIMGPVEERIQQEIFSRKVQ
ncbi:MAG: hypothetical protein AB7F35_23410 [Acetobacteraceae bacterium]